MLGLRAVVPSVGKRAAADTLVVEFVHVCCVRDRQVVLGSEHKPEAGASFPQRLRRRDVRHYRLLIAGGIERNRIDDSELIDLPMLKRQRKVAAVFGDRSAEFKPITLFADGGAAGGERVLGVHPPGALRGKQRAVEVGLPWLGIDLYAASAVGRPGVLGGEQIWVDTNESDGRLGRNLTAVLKTVHGHDGLSGCAACGCGQYLEFTTKLVRIIGELREVVFIQGARAGDILAVDAGLLCRCLDLSGYGLGLEAYRECVDSGADLEFASNGLEAG